MSDISSISIAAGVFGSVTIGTLVFLLMQIVKAFAPTLEGPIAELTVIIVSLASVSLALVSVHSDWYATDTYLALIIGTLGTTVIARGVYAQLFKVAVEGVPPRTDSEVPLSAVEDDQPKRRYRRKESL